MVRKWLGHDHIPQHFAAQVDAFTQEVLTPYEKLKSLPDAARYLRPGVTFDALDARALAMTDLEANMQANRARDALFRAIGQATSEAA